MFGIPYGRHSVPGVASGSPRRSDSASAARRASYGPAYCGLNTSGPGAGGAVLGSGVPCPGRYAPQRPVMSGVEVFDCATSVATASTTITQADARDRGIIVSSTASPPTSHTGTTNDQGATASAPR